MNKKVSLLLSAVMITALVFTGCGNKNRIKNNSTGNPVKKEAKNDTSSKGNVTKDISDTYSGKEGKIMVYMSGPETMVKNLEEKFEEKNGDVIEIFHTGCGPLRQKVWTEMEAGNIQADVIWGSEPSMYIALKNKDKLMQYKSSEMKNMIDEYVYGDGYYTAVSARYGVIIYNKDKIKNEDIPKSWKELEEAKWKGKIAMADAAQSATALALTSGLYQINNKSWDFLKALKDNEVMLTKQNIEAVSKVETGEVDIAIAPHDGVVRLMNKAKKQGIKSPLAISWPEEGALSAQRPIAIIKNNARPKKNQEIAEKFVDFILSQPAQKICTKFGFITVRKDLELPKAVPADVKFVNIDWKDASDNEEEIRRTFSDIMFKQ